jgi:hypothetical protein
MSDGVNVDANLVVAISSAFLKGLMDLSFPGREKNPGLVVSVALSAQLTFLPAFTAE